MVFSINGTDITPYIELGGLEYELVEVTGPNEGISIEGDDIIDVVAKKDGWRVKLITMTETARAQIMTLIQSDTVGLTYTDPRTRQTVTRLSRVSDRRDAIRVVYRRGTAYFEGVSFRVRTTGTVI